MRIGTVRSGLSMKRCGVRWPRRFAPSPRRLWAPWLTSGRSGQAKLAAYYQFISYFPNYFKKLGSTIFFSPSTRGASRERQGRGRVRQIVELQHTSRLANVCLWMYRKGINSSFLTRLFVWKCVAKVFSFEIWSLLRNAARSGRRFGVNSRGREGGGPGSSNWFRLGIKYYTLVCFIIITKYKNSLTRIIISV